MEVRNKYPIAFEEYYEKSEGMYTQHHYWLVPKYKHACYLAWKAGRRYEKKARCLSVIAQQLENIERKK
jgi:hypothetical protein